MQPEVLSASMKHINTREEKGVENINWNKGNRGTAIKTQVIKTQKQMYNRKY